MRLATDFLLPAICWTTQLASAATAHVYTHDPQSQPGSASQQNILDPVAARLVLAQRAGVEGFHKSELTREEVVDAINAHGLRTPLFAEHDDSIRRAFIFVEADRRPETLEPHHAFELSPAPAAPAAQGLFIDLARQSNPRNLASLSDEDIVAQLKDSKPQSSKTDLFYLAKTVSDLEETFESLVKSKKWTITAIITPPTDASWQSGKEQKFQWGTYEMPGKQSTLEKRARAPQEEPLTLTDTFKPVESFSAPVSSLADSSEPLRGILPACFTSQSACESATRNCTGHGQCTKKYHDPDSLAPGGGTGLDCFTCQCGTTKSEDGKRTTVWGGPACQKKDISIQFWLITLFTVGMVFLISFAIGTIMEMGSQELPSVIGAGVSGPTARK